LGSFLEEAGPCLDRGRPLAPGLVCLCAEILGNVGVLWLFDIPLVIATGLALILVEFCTAELPLRSPLVFRPNSNNFQLGKEFQPFTKLYTSIMRSWGQFPKQ